MLHANDDLVFGRAALTQTENDLPAGTVNLNGTLDLAGHNATLNGLTGEGLITSSATGPVTLSVETTGQSSTFWGAIEDGGGGIAP